MPKNQNWQKITKRFGFRGKIASEFLTTDNIPAQIKNTVKRPTKTQILKKKSKNTKKHVGIPPGTHWAGLPRNRGTEVKRWAVQAKWETIFTPLKIPMGQTVGKSSNKISCRPAGSLSSGFAKAWTMPPGLGGHSTVRKKDQPNRTK